MRDALLTNAAYQVVTRVPWQRAVTLVVTDMVDVVESDPSVQIRSMRLSVPLPTIIRQRRYVHAPYAVRVHGELASRAGVLLRDKRTCAYCGGRASTVDHVWPKSRGGRDVWDNLVAACAACNSAKGDRTPVEWGVKLLWMPYAPTPHQADQEQVWLALSRAVA